MSIIKKNILNKKHRSPQATHPQMGTNLRKKCRNLLVNILVVPAGNAHIVRHNGLLPHEASSYIFTTTSLSSCSNWVRNLLTATF